MPEIIARSSSSRTPAVWASATTRCSSSAVTWFLDSRFEPSSRKMRALERSSSHTKGAVTFDSQRMGRDMTAAIGSGERSANLLRNDLADDEGEDMS